MTQPLTYMSPDIVLVYILVAFMHFIAGLSLKYCKCLLIALKLQHALGSNSTPFQHVATGIPSDVESVLSRLPLSPCTTAYVCCPRCFTLYKYDPLESHSFPEKCSFSRTPASSRCGASLHQTSFGGRVRSKRKPARLFLYHEMEDWLASLYTRSDIEALLDREASREGGDKPEDLYDILDSPELQNFLGPENDPGRPFLRRPGNEGRLVFSLNMDGFNPLMNKESGKKVTVGAMYMVCLCLPPAVRYHIENVFLIGIIPGPHEPSKEEINHVLRPLVDDLLRLWCHGFYLTSTCHHPQGRLVRGALIPLICDLPAARQMSGFAGHSSQHFCSMCTLLSIDIDNFDYDTWPRRSQQEHRRIAEEWLNAPSEIRREELFEQSGIRWSQLLRLPYWDPTRYVMIDSMHGFFLRMFQRHCRQIWGMGIEIEDGDYPSFKQDKVRPSDEEMKAGYRVLRFGNEKQLRALKLKVLRELARSSESVPYGGKSKKILKDLIQYRIRRGWFDNDGNRIASSATEAEIIAQEYIPIHRAGPTVGATATTQVKRKRDDPPTLEEINVGLAMLESGSKSSLKKIRKPVLMKLCEIKQLPYGDKVVVYDLIELLEDWRLENKIVDSSGNLLVQPQRKKSKKGVGILGKETLKEIRNDMAKLELPSWVAPAPSHPGEAKRGKFTADQWRSFCVVNLTVTLNRLWGSEPENSRKRQMLDNFMHLVTAVKLATMRKVTPARISSYVFHMHAYLSGLLKLYPGTTISPYQHLALHFQEFLSRFGPVHAWRCFPFERYNYLLQNINTNTKMGELEKTLLLTFCKSQALKALLNPTSTALPEELNDLLSEWKELLESDIRGTRQGDTFHFDDFFRLEGYQVISTSLGDLQVMPAEWHDLLKTWVANHGTDIRATNLSRFCILKKSVKRLGETFQTSKASARDSRVYFNHAGDISAGTIEGIFTSSLSNNHPTTFFVVKPFEALPERYSLLDPYRRYPEVAGRLFQSTVGPEIILESKDILYHCGYSIIDIPGIPWPCIHALPLDRF